MRNELLGIAAAACLVFINNACGGGTGGTVVHTGLAGSTGSAGTAAGTGTAGATGAAGSGAGHAGSTGTAGSGTGKGGTTGATGAAGTTGTTGAAGTTSAAGATGAAGSLTGAAAATGAAGTGVAGNYGGIIGLENLSTVKMSSGCGKDPGQQLGSWQAPPAGGDKYQFGYALMTPDTPKGSFTRHYFVKLPSAYDRTKPYRVIYEGTACGGVGYDVPAYDTAYAASPNVANDPHGSGPILVGMTPDPTVSMGGCFDDKAGAMTIEKAYIETLAPLIASKFCVDEHRVFISGHDTGGRLSNQFGHVYGSRIFRAIAPSAGGLADAGSGQLQPCLTAGLPDSATTVGGCLPVPGIWFHDLGDTVDQFTGTHDAIVAALIQNHCPGATFEAGPKMTYLTLSMDTCLKYTSCPAEFPIVLCTSNNQGHANQLDQMDSRVAAWNFFKAF